MKDTDLAAFDVSLTLQQIIKRLFGVLLSRFIPRILSLVQLKTPAVFGFGWLHQKVCLAAAPC